MVSGFSKFSDFTVGRLPVVYGILNCLIEGALRWKQEGLKVPAVITNATDERAHIRAAPERTWHGTKADFRGPVLAGLGGSGITVFRLGIGGFPVPLPPVGR
jgi:hypothetical protein